MDIQGIYTWRALYPDGSERITGEDIAGAAMVSLIPLIPSLPQHDMSGLSFIRRFGRGFLKGMGGGLREYVHCIVTDTCRIYIRSTTGSVLVTHPEYELYL